MTNNLPIGVFDSGVGGLTVAKEIMLRLPKESLLYFGDTARVPYGNKSEETVITYSRQIARFLCSHEVKAIVIACNTASAFALDTLAAEFPVPVIGVVKPGAKAAAAKTAKGRIGVIATSGTIKSGLYERYLASINPELKVFGKACPLSLKITSTGVVTATLTFDTGKKSKGKVVYYKPTCSTVVKPMSDADPNAFTGHIQLYFAPSAGNNFPGWSEVITVSP